MNNLCVKVNDELGLLEEIFGKTHKNMANRNKFLGKKSYKERLKKFEGNFLEVGNYLIPSFKIPFLDNRSAEIDTSENVGNSKKNYVRVTYHGDNTDVREIKYNKGIIKIDNPRERMNYLAKEMKKII